MHDWEGRPRAPIGGSEREQLDGWLDFHRATLLRKCVGLTDDQLKRAPVPPSTLTLLGLVRHMTEVDRSWFLTFLGVPHEPVHATADDEDRDWHGVPGADPAADPAADLAAFRRELDVVREVVRGHELDEVASEPEWEHNLRWVYLHLIEEYARHNGHADLLREVIDGVTGD